jgi:NAD(P)H-quinone oxidoreductase subunit 4
MTSLALSSMSGFVAELIVFFDFLITKRLITFVMAIGMILTPIYSYLC